MATRAALALLLVAGGCDAASSELGLEAWLQIPGAQWRPGASPQEDGGPEVLGVQSAKATLQIGAVRERLRGQLGTSARAVVIGLAGDRGTWLVPAAPPDAQVPDVPSFDVRLQIGEELPPGPVELLVSALDDRERAGPPQRLRLDAVEEAPPAGRLVVALTWDGPADLDLHVVDPLGGEAWSGDPNTWQPPPPGEPVPPEAWRSGGILSQDGNANCRRDGSPSEHVVWQLPPPSGSYAVRVDIRALCGAAAASWRVAAYLDDATTMLGAVRGVSLPDDVLRPHGRGAGVHALSFTLAASP